MDKAGRIVVPAALRARIGLVPGPVSITESGAGLQIDPIPADRLVEKDGRLVIDVEDLSLSAEEIRELRLADQR